MLKNLSQDIRVIQGIGPRTAALFSRQGIHTVLDLLAHPSRVLRKPVTEVASIRNVGSWTSMAQLAAKTVAG